MANDITGILSSAEQAQANYEKYKDKYVDATEELVNSETFMQLLVAEMTNQDPLEPTSNTEFISQLASFSQMQYMRDSSKYSMATYAASLVGKTATASKMDGGNLVTKTGVVESVSRNDSTNSYTVKIDGVTFDLSKVTGVKETPKSESAESEETAAANAVNSANALGDSIARASAMVGMFATVTGGEGESAYLDQGFITAIQVKDGVISAVINEIARPLSDIIEVTYATVVDEPASKPEDMVSSDMEQEFLDLIKNEIDEQTVLQTGAVTPEKYEEDIADIVDEEEEGISAVQSIEG